MVNFDYLYNPAAAKGVIDKNYFSDEKLGFKVINHGTILPHKDCRVNRKWTWGKGGIVDSAGKFVPESFVHLNVGTSYTPPPDNSSEFRDGNLSRFVLSSLGALYNR